MDRSSGVAWVELLVATSLAALAVAIALPAAARLRGSGRTEAGARILATTFQAMRWRSVSRHKNCGLFFERRGAGWIWWEVQDGNGNGLRTSEVRSGVDPTLAGPCRLEDRVETVTLGFPPGGPFPEIPPGDGTIGETDDPVQFGHSDLVSFSTDGCASSGTLYLTDGRGALSAVVLFGATARVRVWRYDPVGKRWSL